MQKAAKRDNGVEADRMNFGADAEAIRRLEMANKSTYLESRPLFMGIEPTTYCNLRCKMCSHGGVGMGKEFRGHMSREIFDSAREFFPYGVVQFAGLGEIFVHPRFLEMLTCAAREAKSIHLVTNATLLTRKVSELLVDLNVQNVTVSIDARNPALFQEIRGFPLEKVLENICGLTKARRQNGSRWPLLWVSFTIMQSNVQEMPAVVELAADLGAEGVSCCVLKNFPHQSPGFFNKEQLDFSHPEVERIIRLTQETAERHGILIGCCDFWRLISQCESNTCPSGPTSTTSWVWYGPVPDDANERESGCELVARVLRAANVTDRDVEEVCSDVRSGRLLQAQLRCISIVKTVDLNPDRPSDEAFRSLVIRWTGGVHLNCESSMIGANLLGNLSEQSLSQIWNGEPIRRLRRDWYRMEETLKVGVSE